MQDKYEIPLKLPSLNEYIKACRSNKFAGARMKAKWEQVIGFYLIKMSKIIKPIKINFTWVESNKKRDIDNIIFAQKFILDSMVKYGKIIDDSPKYIKEINHKVIYDKKNKVILEIEETNNDIY